MNPWFKPSAIRDRGRGCRSRANRRGSIRAGTGLAKPTSPAALAGGHFQHATAGALHKDMTASRPVQQEKVFVMALGLAGTPCREVDLRLEEVPKGLVFDLAFDRGNRSPLPDASQPCGMIRTVKRTAPGFFKVDCFTLMIQRVASGLRFGLPIRIPAPREKPHGGPNPHAWVVAAKPSHRTP